MKTDWTASRAGRDRFTRRRLLATSVAAIGSTLGSSWLSGASAQPTRGPVTVKLWYIAQGPKFDPVIKAAVQEFESSHTSIKVELDVEPAIDLRNKVRPIFSTGGPGPDIVYEGAVQTLTYASMPYGFIDLTDRIKASGVMQRTPRPAWIPLGRDGKFFGIPLIAFPFLMAYNKDLYAAAGIKGVPQSWDEQRAIIKKVWNAQKGVFGFETYTDRFFSWIFEPLMYDSGLGYFNGSEQWDKFDVTQPVTFNGPQGVRILEYIRDLCETAPGGLRGNIGIDASSAVSLFAKGSLAHFHSHTIQLSLISSANPAMVGGKNFDVYVFPKGPKRKGAAFSTSVFGITKGSRDPDAAWDLVNFLAEKWEGPLSASIGCVPIRRNARVPSDAPEWLISAGRRALASEGAFPSAFFPQLDLVRIPLGKEVQAFFLGQKTARQALDDAAEETRKAVKR